MIPLGEYRPDLPDFQNPGATEALNAFPDFTSYRRIPGQNALDNATGAPAAAVIGAFYSEQQPASLEAAGTQWMYAGTVAKLYRYAAAIAPAAWADVTRVAGGDYTAGRWRFVKFGARVIGVDGSGAPQSFLEGTDTDFSALAGSPPSGAQVVSVVRDFVNMAPLSNTQHWSAIDDPEDWTPSATTQSDTQTIPEGGFITGLASGEYGVTFMENAIYRQTYIGSPLIFQFDKITSNVGMRLDTSLAQFENICFFHSGDAFYMLVGGQQLIPIGEGKVDRFFRDEFPGNVTPAYIKSACVDTVRKLYCVHYQNADGDARLLFYHWPSQRWSRMEAVVDSANVVEFIVAAKTIMTGAE